MFPSMDITNSGNQPVVIRTNQSQQPQQSQVFTQQYGYQQQQQQQQHQSPYFAAYPNVSPTSAAAASAKGGMNFVAQQTSSSYGPPPQVFSYGYASQVATNSQYVANPMRYPANQINQQPLPAMGYMTECSSQDVFPQQQRGSRGRGGGGGFIPHFRQVHNNYYYNQQHHCSSNNAVPEKTPTVHVMHPTSKKVMGIKLNRIYSTMADLRPQLLRHQQQPETSSKDNSSSSNSAIQARPNTVLLLCLDFLNPRGCVHGSGCDKVHVAGLEYMWNPIEAFTTFREGREIYNAGFQVNCYDPTHTKYYSIPSECVELSQGSQRYVDMFNEHGDNFKTKLKLCVHMLKGESCEKGKECEDIHCTPMDFVSVQKSNARDTHINDPEAMMDVSRLPAEMTVRVFEQNSADTFRDYPGTNVLLTEGAKIYSKYYGQELNRIPPRKRMQHCAHFRLKDMCRLGASCRFLHVLPTPEELRERKQEMARVELKDLPHQQLH